LTNLISAQTNACKETKVSEINTINPTQIALWKGQKLLFFVAVTHCTSQGCVWLWPKHIATGNIVRPAITHLSSSLFSFLIPLVWLQICFSRVDLII